MDKKRKHRDDGGYALVENMIVLPIVFLVIYALLFAGFMLHAQCTIESAARRGVLYAAKLICDPQYEVITADAVNGTIDLNELANQNFDFGLKNTRSYQPYRYMPFLCGNYYKEIAEKTRTYVRSAIGTNSTWMFTIDDASVSCDISNFVITQNVTVRVTAKYETPKVMQWLGVDEYYDLEANAVMTVSDQDEFIRNADYVAGLLGKALDKTGIMQKIGEPMKKVSAFIEKIFK